VLGPSLTRAENASNEIIGKLVRREVPGVPRLQFPVVDVRDVAVAHVLAMTAPGVAGERFIVTSETAWYAEIARLLADSGYRVPTRQIPNFVTRAVSLFDPTLRFVVNRLGRRVQVSNDKVKTRLGWSGRPLRDMVLDTARHMTQPHAAS